MTIKFGVMPGRINEFVLEEGSTVSTVADLAGESLSGYMIKVNGDAANADTVLNDGDTVILSKQLKGNA